MGLKKEFKHSSRSVGIVDKLGKAFAIASIGFYSLAFAGIAQGMELIPGDIEASTYHKSVPEMVVNVVNGTESDYQYRSQRTERLTDTHINHKEVFGALGATAGSALLSLGASSIRDEDLGLLEGESETEDPGMEMDPDVGGIGPEVPLGIASGAVAADFLADGEIDDMAEGLAAAAIGVVTIGAIGVPGYLSYKSIKRSFFSNAGERKEAFKAAAEAEQSTQENGVIGPKGADAAQSEQENGVTGSKGADAAQSEQENGETGPSPSSSVPGTITIYPGC